MYGGEAVTQLQHALQGATLARAAGAPAALVTASLLHDIGHLLHDLPENAASNGIDDLHENRAVQYLSAYFGPEVTEPVRLHVDAKRYLCATEAGYLKKLSAPSIQSLAIQGGPMQPHEIAVFEASPFYLDAVQLRKWDDSAKDPGLETASIETFASDLAAALRQ